MNGLEVLVSQLKQKTNVSSVYVARYLDGEDPRVESLVFLHHDKFFPSFSYSLGNAPCQCVYQKGYFFCGKGIDERFPGDSDLKKLLIIAYEGIVLKRDGKVLGHLALLDQKEISRHKEILVDYAERVLAGNWL